MKQSLIALLICSLLIFNANCLNFRGLQKEKDNSSQQNLPSENFEQPRQLEEEPSHEQEEQQTQNDQGETNQENQETQEDEDDEVDENEKAAIEAYNNYLQESILGLMSESLKVNKEKEELLKQIAFFSIENLVEHPESLTAEDIHEQGNILFHNAQAIEKLKELNQIQESILLQLQELLQ